MTYRQWKNIHLRETQAFHKAMTRAASFRRRGDAAKTSKTRERFYAKADEARFKADGHREEANIALQEAARKTSLTGR